MCPNLRRSVCVCVCARVSLCAYMSCHSLQQVIFEAPSLQFLSVFPSHLLIKRPSPSLSSSFSTLSRAFFFLCASCSRCLWLYDREKCVYKTHSLTDQTIQTNQRLWREKREAEKKRVRKDSQRDGVKQRVCGGLIILKFSVCYFFFPAPSRA